MKERTIRYSRNKADGLYYLITEDGRVLPCARCLSSRKKILANIETWDTTFGTKTTVIFE